MRPRKRSHELNTIITLSSRSRTVANQDYGRGGRQWQGSDMNWQGGQMGQSQSNPYGGEGFGNQGGYQGSYQSSSQGSYGNPSYENPGSYNQSGYGGQGALGGSYSGGNGNIGTLNRQQSGPHAGRGPKGYRRSDERIQEEINEQLMRHPNIDPSEVTVQVQNGEVTLTSTVDDRQSKRLAEDIAESCSGVSEVHNQLRVQRGTQGRETLYDTEVPRRAEHDRGTEQARHADHDRNQSASSSTTGTNRGNSRSSGTSSTELRT